MPDFISRCQLTIIVHLLVATLANGAFGQASLGNSPKLRFEQAVYPAGGCAQLILEMAQVTGGLVATVEVAVVHQGSRLGSIIAPVNETAQGSGMFRSVNCVRLTEVGSSGGGSDLPVKPGARLLALATDSHGQPLAVALAMIGEAVGAGRFQPMIDPTLTSEAGSRTDIGIVSADGGGIASFVLGRVILRAERPSDMSAFLARRKGRILSSGMNRGDTNAPATYHLVEVDVGTVDLGGFAAMVESWTNAEGVFRFSSTDAMALLALVFEEQASGNFVELDLLLKPQAVPRSIESGGVSDFFAGPWFNPQAPGSSSLLRIGEGVALAQIVAKPTIVTPVPVAIVDSGFASPSNYVPPAVGTLDYGAPFNSIPQCSIDAAGFANCAPGSAAGPNTDGSLCDITQALCQWHGTAVFSAAAAVLHNGFGAAGTGAPVAAPILIKIEGNSFSWASGIDQAMNPPNSSPARIINASFGIRCKLLILNICDPVDNTILITLSCTALLIAFPTLVFAPVSCPAIATLAAVASHIGFMEAALTSAWNKGAVVVAGAPNENIDVAEEIFRPCVDDHALCVSALNPAASSSISSRPNAGHGSSIDVWAPSGTIVTSIPPSATALPPTPFSGTSNATPIVSGALAIVRAIDPALTPDGVVALLRSANCSSASSARLGGLICSTSGDAKVNAGGYLDFLELVRRARLGAGRPVLMPCTGGWDGAERAGRGDTADTALPIPPIPPTLQAERMFEESRDLSIHGLLPPVAPVQSEEDWYAIQFEPRQVPTPTGPGPVGFLIRVTVPVQDPGLGRLEIDIFRRSVVDGGPPIVPVLPHSKQDSTGGEAVTHAIVRTDLDYFARVKAVLPVTRNSNCYGGVIVRVLEPMPLPPVRDF